MFQPPNGYGFGFYHNRPTASYGVWFGFGQIQVHRWAINICMMMKKLDNGRWYNRFWWTVGIT